jgi:hypothetical protein
VTNDISPYLQRPVRRLEEVIAEAEQQRLEQTPVPSTGAVDTQKSEAATTSSS